MGKLDTRAIGLDTALGLSRWLTGKEHLHYGLWTDLDVSAGNVARAQDAYTARLFALLPNRAGLRILDIGGGAGETAKKLIALGHHVEIVIPSAFLAARCRANAPQAIVHECRFEEFQGSGGFDLCLFSESFQYIALDISLPKAQSLLAPMGEIVIGDCFRSETFQRNPLQSTAGGGHPIAAFRAALATHPLQTLHEEDITEAVAPSIDLEQQFFNVFGIALGGFNRELSLKKPFVYKALMLALRLGLSTRKRVRLTQRLFAVERTAADFVQNNRYLLIRLAKS